MRRLIRLTVILFISYLCVAISLPIVSIYVSATLGLSNVWAGLGVGATFLATIVSRQYAGQLSDALGSATATKRDLFFYVFGAVVTILSSCVSTEPFSAFLVLLVGRLFVGIAESLVAVGVISWGIGLIGPERSGKVMAMVGTAMYGTLAVGGPLRIAILSQFGFAISMLVAALLPCAGLIAFRFVPIIAPTKSENLPFDEWTETLGSERLTGALLDRITHHVNILEMNGDSYRLAQSRARKAG